jgi:hypothetical protein
MKKMQEKNKIYNIHTKAPTPPQTKPYGWQTPISPRKSANREESRDLVKMSANSLNVYISHLNVPLLYMISQRVVSPSNMSHLFVKD